MRIVRERDDLIHTIRAQPGLDRFLLPKEYTELCQAAQNGPIVVLNANKMHCDALVILNPTSDPLHIPLPEVNLSHLENQQSILKDVLQRCNSRTRDSQSSRLFGSREGYTLKPVRECFDEILTGLWTHVVKPIFHALESRGVTDGRLWWCPVGAFVGLPLHAAAPSDQFIPSYTSSLATLLESNSKESLSGIPTLGVIGVTHTQRGGVSALPGVEREIARINSITGNICQIEKLVGEQATVEAVKLQLNNCSWVHLACHGTQNLKNPPKSCLHLYDGILELETILKLLLSNAEFVFLAACQTAMGDSNLVNESFHLSGGLIAAGFRAAIGTMWSMRDEDGPVVAEIVYKDLFGHGRHPKATDTAKALQLAVRKLRDDGVPYEHWVPFIHMGV
ncbi:CHAT domain-containing protein [Mycena leptocephala]|nr:CHAT domain-containing protein [Mycena leptocephala]